MEPVGRTIRVRLEGDTAHLGQVQASDVARLILGLERTVARASGSIANRPVNWTAGRWGALIEGAVKFRLVSIEEASVGLALEVPEPETSEEELDVDDTRLGELALERTLRVVTGAEDDPVVASALLELGRQVGVGTRYKKMTLANAGRKATLNRRSMTRLDRAVAAHRARTEKNMLAGRLYEADFETRTAHLRRPNNDKVVISFDPELDDDIQDALRSDTQVAGDVEYDPHTQRATKIKLTTIESHHQLSMPIRSGTFWEPLDLEQLQEDQGVGPITDVESLRPHDTSADGAEAFLAALET